MHGGGGEKAGMALAAGGLLTQVAGNVIGGAAGARRNQRKGYYQREVAKSERSDHLKRTMLWDDRFSMKDTRWTGPRKEAVRTVGNKTIKGQYAGMGIGGAVGLGAGALYTAKHPASAGLAHAIGGTIGAVVGADTGSMVGRSRGLREAERRGQLPTGAEHKAAKRRNNPNSNIPDGARKGSRID